MPCSPCVSTPSRRPPGKVNFCFNAATDEDEDPPQSGVIAPLKVSRTALQNATSIAGLMLTTEAVVSELPEKKKATAPHSPEMDY